MSVVVVFGRGKAEAIKVTPEIGSSDIDPMLVIEEMRNLAQEVRDVDRVTRIVRFRISRLEDAAQATKFPQNSERYRSRADAYRCWLFHLELITQ